MKRTLFIVMYIFVFVQSSIGQDLNWAKNIGSVYGSSKTTDVAVDSNGNIYAVGIFSGNEDFEPGPGTTFLNSEAADKGNYFCVKYSSSGQFIWARQTGGSSGFSSIVPEYYEPKIQISNDIIFIAGVFAPTVDFDPSPSVYLVPNPDGELTRSFISTYTTSGDLGWVKAIEDAHSLTIQNLATDSQHNILIAGGTLAPADLDPSLSSSLISTGTPNRYHSYILKLSSSGEFIWAKEFDNPTTVEFSHFDYPYGLATDLQDNVLISGSYEGTLDFDPSDNENSVTSNNNSIDIYLVKLNSDGELQWAHSIGSNSTVTSADRDEGHSVATDNLGNIYLGGTFTKTIDMDPSPSTASTLTTYSGAIYVAKYTPDGDFVFTKGIECMNNIGIGLSERVYDINVDDQGSLFFTGTYLTSMDCDPDGGVAIITANGGNAEMFFISYSSENGQFQWAKSIGGTAADFGRRIAVSNINNAVVVVGAFQGESVNFDYPDSYLVAGSSGQQNGFLVNYNTSSLNIDHHILETSIVVYPNPATDYLNIVTNTNLHSVLLYDITGKQINCRIDGTILDVSQLSKGIYLLKLLTDNDFKFIKFIKS